MKAEHAMAGICTLYECIHLCHENGGRNEEWI